MKSFGEYWDDLKKDPKRLKRLFTTIWVTSYAVLILGFFLIIWVLLYGS